MSRPTEMETETGRDDRDERMGEAIETYLALVEVGQAPPPDVFAAGYPDLAEELIEALDGLALVQGLVGGGDSGGHRLEAGRRVAGYRIVRELGRGGMGIVYEAVHVGLDRPVALKVLGGYATPDSSGRRRFLNEARTAAGLHHTHIVPVFDVGQVGGLCYYAMQRIEGCGLDRVLKRMRRDRSTAACSTHPSVSKANSFPRPAGSALHWSQASGSSVGGGALLVESGGMLVTPDDEDNAPFNPPRGGAYYRWVAAVGCQAADALQHAHAQGIIHRDVKPSNLLVDSKGTIWVADFGLARRLADPSLTQVDSLLGTPRYMSPEQTKSGPIDGRADVYSLGATLYELLTLSVPFNGQSAAELVDQIRLKDVTGPRKIDKKTPRDLETIVLKCLAKRPSDRYASAGELSEDLERFLAMEPVRARRIGPIGRTWRFARRHPALAGVSTAATIAVLSTAGYAYVRVLQERDLAVVALAQAEIAATKATHAEAETKAKMATLLRYEVIPDRRNQGLELLKAAASQAFDDTQLRSMLRDEAIEFLALRDVAGWADLDAGPSRGVVFGNRQRMVTLSEDSRTLKIWDLSAEPKQPLRSIVQDEVTETRSSGVSRRSTRVRTPVYPFLANVGGSKAIAVWAGGQELLVLDLASDSAKSDDRISVSDRQILGVLGPMVGDHFITIERPYDRTAQGSDSGSSLSSNDGQALTGSPRGRTGREAPYSINLWNASSPRQDPITLEIETGFDTSGTPTAPLVSISPDGDLIATSTRNGEDITLWSARTGTKLNVIETQTNLSSIVLGPNGLLAAAGSGSIRLWDTRTKTPLPGLTPRQSFVQRLRFTPDGSLLAVSGLSEEVEIWDAAENQLVAVLRASEPIRDLAFAPTERRLAVAGSSTTLPIWEIVESTMRVRLDGLAQFPSQLAFSTEGALAIGTLEGPPKLWNSQEPRITRNLLGVGNPTALSIDPQANQLVTFDPLSRMLRWSGIGPEDGAGREIKVPKAPSRPLGSDPMVWSHNGKTLVFASGDEVFKWSVGEPQKVRQIGDFGGSELFRPPSTRPPATPSRAGQPAENPPRAGSSEPARRVGTFSRGRRSLALDPTGKRLYLAAPPNSELVVWDLSKNPPSEIQWPNVADGVLGLAISDDGETLALIDRANVVSLVDTSTKQAFAKLVPPGGTDYQASTVAFAPAGGEIAVGTRQGAVLVWSILDKSIQPILTLKLPSHRGFVTSLAYDFEGNRLASSASDKRVNVWDITKLREQLSSLGLDW